MSNLLTTVGRSSSVKLLTIGLLSLLLLIPASMIHSVINERAGLAQQARADIMTAWGREQSLAGPILVVPYTRVVTGADDKPMRVKGRIHHLPSEARIDHDVDVQMRYRGLYTVPVYEASVNVDATFDAIPIDDLGLGDATLDYERARLVVGLSDPRTLRETPVATVDGRDVRFGAGSHDLPELGPQIVAALGTLDLGARGGAMTVKSGLRFAGTDTLNVAPVANTNDVTMTADWPSPSFQGQYLPVEREVNAAGFTARWQVTSLGRQYPGTWLNGAVDAGAIHGSYFGATLKEPLGTYDMARRAVRYAILAIGLTFACFFLFDVISALHLHPVQYLLVGFANCLFFLLLLTLAEHLAFVVAYLLSAAACIGLIGGYSAAVLHARGRALVCVAALIAMYGFLFMTLRAQSFALLAGSVGLWVVLGAVMYLTRRVDWHAAGSGPGTPAADGQTR